MVDPPRSNKQAAPPGTEQELLASPDLKKGKHISSIKRTPQPILTQSKLTSMLHAASAKALSLEKRRAPLVTEDFLLRTMKENTEQILKSFSAHLLALLQRVNGNGALMADNQATIARHGEELSSHRTELVSLAALEKGGGQRRTERPEQRRTPLSQNYLLVRGSIPFWPVPGSDDTTLWEGAGDLIHDILLVSQDDVCQDKIEAVSKVLDHTLSIGRDEILVTFCSSRKRVTIHS